MTWACPLVVKEFYVFTTKPQGELIPETEKILYFYPNGKSEDYQLSATGLCEALLSFSNFFSSVCTVLQTRNGKHCFHSISDRIWAVMNVSFVDPSVLPHGYEACERFIDDNVMSHKLAALCERFELLFGPVLTASDTEVKESRKNLQTFFNRELAMIDLSLNDIPDLIEAVRWKFCSPKNLLKLDNLGTQIQLSCPFPKTDAAFLYDAQLVWSTLPLKDLRVVLQYVTSDIMSMPPDLDLSAISSGAPHMGRFLTGSPDMGIELCPAQTPVPILYQRLPNSEYRRIHVLVYRALRLTLCLLIDGEHKLEKEFFHTFDTLYGNALTELSSEMEVDSSEGTSLSSDVATLPPVIEATSKTNQSTSGFPSLGGFLLWEPELASLTTNLFFISSGGRGEVIPSFASLLPIIFAARKDAISSFNQRWYECLVKLEPDTWMHLRRLNKREVFLIFSGKKVDISTVINVMDFLFRIFGCCCSRWRRQNLNHWENVHLYTDDEDGQETEGLMPLYSFSQPQPQTAVRLDLASAGQFAVIVKNSTRLCGSGAARGNAPIVQDKAYFEVKVQTRGLWAIGLCHSKADLNVAEGVRNQNSAWVLFHDGIVYHESKPLMELESRIKGLPALEEGDILGVYYDHTELRFAINGVLQYLREQGIRCTGVTGIRGTVYPLLAVDGGAILDARFTNFQYPPREGGFSEIRFEKDIL